MNNGWLVVNGYITNPKFLEIYQWLMEAGARKGYILERKTNIELMEKFCDDSWQEMEKPDFVMEDCGQLLALLKK